MSHCPRSAADRIARVVWVVGLLCLASAMSAAGVGVGGVGVAPVGTVGPMGAPTPAAAAPVRSPPSSDTIGSEAPPSPASAAPYWTNLTSAYGPPGGYSEAMTYDDANQTVLLFGENATGGGTFGDGTWEFSRGVWADISSSAGAPPPDQSGMAMTYDQRDGYVLMFGCLASTVVNGNCNDTWSFANGTWRQVDAVDSPAAGDINGNTGLRGPLSLAYDAADGYTLLTNGFDTWEYAGGVWSPLCEIPSDCSAGFIPGPNLSGTAVYDAHDGYVLFVGVAEQNESIVGGGSWTWEFAGGQWTNVSASVGTAPSPRLGAQMTYDSTTGNVVLFGGTSCLIVATCGAGDLNDTWTFQSGTWQNVTSSGAPPARSFGEIADDPPDAAIVLFSGIVEVGPDPDSAGNDTWTWGTSPPIAGLSISVAPATPVPGAPAQFTSSFRGGIAPFSYGWEFGDGGSSSLPNPSHTFAGDGVYPVNLSVSDSAGHTATASISVPVYATLSVRSLDAEPDPAILGQPVNFSAVAAGGTPPYAYSWAFGDGGTGGDLANITHIYTTNGPFEATVSVTDAVGSTANATVNVSIRLQALAGFTPPSAGAPLTVDFLGQGQGGTPPYRYSWAFGDGATSSEEDPIHAYRSDGEFTAVLTVFDARGNSSNVSLTVRLGPAASGGSPLAPWTVELAIGAGAAGAVVAAWSVTFLRRRARRQEGEAWINELTAETGPPGSGKNR